MSDDIDGIQDPRYHMSRRTFFYPVRGFACAWMTLRAVIYFDIIILVQQLWVAGEGPTIEWSYLPRKIVREKRLFFRGHGDCIF